MKSAGKSETEAIFQNIVAPATIPGSGAVGIIRLSELLGIPKHKVRYSLRLLERDGLIVATQEGARVTEKYDEFMADLSEKLDSIIDRVNKIRDEVSQ